MQDRKADQQAKPEVPELPETLRTREKNGKEYGTVLSGKQKKELVRQRMKQKKAVSVPCSAQQSIAYEQMFRDGICRVDHTHYTKTISFEDINYRLEQNEQKSSLFEYWCDFYNYFDSSISLQITSLSQQADQVEIEKPVSIPLQGDDFDPVREEFEQVLQMQLAKGNNGLIHTRYVTFGVQADSIGTARPRLERIETDIISNLKMMGVRCHSLSGYERLRLLHSIMNEDTGEPFVFNFDLVEKTGLTTKDFIAPTSFDFRGIKEFRMGEVYGNVSFLQILAPELSDKVMEVFMDTSAPLIISMHVEAIDQEKAIKQIKSKITELDKTKIDEQKRAVRSGYDMDVLPSDLITYGGEAKKILEDLQSRNERLFVVTILFMTTAKTREKLRNTLLQIKGSAQTYNCPLRCLDFQQEQGLMSCLPLGNNQIEIGRSLTTSATAIFLPFMTQELFQGGDALYYGINAVSNNLIMADRKTLKNPNGLILGTPGTGKSFLAKREIVNAFLITTDDIIICDPESEYHPLVDLLHGQVIRICADSTQYVNPMDLNLDYAGTDESPLTLKADFILSLCELIIARRTGLEPVEKTIIDRCVRLVYQEYLEDPDPEKMPVLEDLYNCILQQEEPEAKRLATALEIYVKGSLNVFNHRTNVDIHNRLVCFDIRELGKQLKKLGMLIIQDQVWNRVTCNRNAHKATRYYMDEIHLLLKEEQTAAYSVEIWKRFRKWGGIPTGLTQNVKDLLESREITNIFENSDCIFMLSQAPDDRKILAKQLNISPEQLKAVTNSISGEGLMVFGETIIQFKDNFPKNTMLYKIMTTKLSDMSDNLVVIIR